MNWSVPSRRFLACARAWPVWALLWAAIVTAVAPVYAASPAPPAASAPGEKRFALVIGNARYPAAPLNNPENDARVVASTLRRLGFDVAEHVNLPVKDFRRVLREYSRRVQNEEGVAVFFYAGHGVQIDGRNYLLPVDLNLRDEDEIKDEAVDIDELFVSRLERARAQVRLVILDACRDNPFGPKTRSLRSVSSGLAEMGARGTLIAYSSAPGATAEDGPAGTNSVFTRHLVKEMLTEGIEVEQMFKNVRVKVLRDTNQRQVPWLNTSLTVNFSFNPKLGPNSEDPAKREDLARLQALLDQRDREQKKLEEELQRLSRQLERAGADPKRPAVAASAAPAASAALAAKPVAPPASAAVAAKPAASASPPAAVVAKPAASAVVTPPPVVAAKPPPPVASSAPPSVTAAAPAASTAASLASHRPNETKVVAKAPLPAASAARREPADRPVDRPVAVVAPSAPDSAPPRAKLATANTGRAGAGGSSMQSERCVALLIRASLGEPIPAAEMAYLKECR